MAGLDNENVPQNIADDTPNAAPTDNAESAPQPQTDSDNGTPENHTVAATETPSDTKVAEKLADSASPSAIDDVLPMVPADSNKSSEYADKDSTGRWNAFTTYTGLYLWAAVFGLITTLVLFLRPTPYGMDYVMDIWHYMPHAIFYMMFGLAIICFPFFIVALIRKRATFAGTTICALLIMISLFLGHADNEVLRYCKIHVSADFIQTYVLRNGKPEAVWALFETDQGGKNLSLYLLGLAPAFFISWLLLIRRFVKKIPPIKKYSKQVIWSTTGLLIFCFIFLPAFFRTDLFGSKNRQAFVAPPAVLLRDGIMEYVRINAQHADLTTLVPKFQNEWLEAESDKNWKFIDTKRPFMKTYNGTCPNTSEPAWNVIVISLETFRSRNLPLFYPGAESSPTPFIDSIATSPNAAYYPNYFTNGHPTIAAFMAQHTSILPHSDFTVAQRYTLDTINSYASILKSHNYQNVFFAGSDPDWDNMRIWLTQWYDKIFYTPDYKAEDRLVMQDAVRWLREDRDPSRPFLMTFFLISNHTPFTMPDSEEHLKLTDSSELKYKITNTMHYNDDVVKEFISSIQNEPWYENTIILITGDHGMDLGDRGDTPDYDNLRSESIQVPLILYNAKHPRMPHGKQNIIGSHLDLGPTILDLVHLCDDNSFMGHSLLSVVPEKAQSVSIKHNRFAIYTNDYSIYMPDRTQAMMFSHDDYAQNTDISSQNTSTVDDIKKYLLSLSSLVNEGYRQDLYH